MRSKGVLAIIPARGGSTGLPGKNIRPFAGLPLIAHSIRLAKLCPEITRCVVSTNSAEIARVAREHGGDVPFLRPARLARADSPTWPALAHALEQVEKGGERYAYVLLLDPTSPTRLPEDVAGALRRLDAEPAADGIVGVSKPDFDPLWHCVSAERGGWMKDFSAEASGRQRRQDVPPVYRINGLLYVWRSKFVRQAENWRKDGRNLIYELPDERACSIDTLRQFERMELLVKHGFIRLPWLEER